MKIEVDECEIIIMLCQNLNDAIFMQSAVLKLFFSTRETLGYHLVELKAKRCPERAEMNGRGVKEYEIPRQ